ncbi:GNAT family N-acetyltransferase [Sporomusa aerivorans]|uniref:GNAT family N-acetyltransferase n=1 Tax=Sporomusa aerivorans TaxID=204936 RepID=UPI00352B27C9
MPDKPFAGLTIEKIQRSDLEQLEKLFASAFGDEVDIEQVRRRIHRARQFYFILQPLSQFSAWVKNHFNVYVAKIAGRVIGFIQVSYLNPTQLHIDYIAFSKQYRGQGLGKWVLNKLLTDVADAKQYDVVLEVRVDNRAYHFYRRLGFKQATKILHYELTLGPEKAKLPQGEQLTGFREVKGRDRAKLYRLYLESVPAALRHVIKRTYGEFNPGMIVRHLDWAKNHLMRKRKKDYIIEREGKIVAWLTVTSYLKIRNHVISLILHPAFESLRPSMILKAISLITGNYHHGTISTTVYNDDPAKQLVLEQLGFKRELSYFLMFRPAAANRQYTDGTEQVSQLRPISRQHLMKHK